MNNDLGYKWHTFYTVSNPDQYNIRLYASSLYNYASQIESDHVIVSFTHCNSIGVSLDLYT